MRIGTFLLASLLAFPLAAAEPFADVDKAVIDVLGKSGAPSASIAIVQDGKLAYTRAYGQADVASKTPASPQMRYSIGSISKQFTAAALLLLAEEGRLSLDDKVIRWMPDLTRAGDVSIRHLLSMTSGYQDFWPQDYVMPGMLEDVTVEKILNDWAKKPLDFEPGSKWQYSNTNYVIAGAIVNRVSGMPFFEFLQRRIFTPLGMTTVYNTDQAALGPEDPVRYHRYSLAPVRVAPKEGRGWMYAAGGLAMTAADLAKWDVAMIERKLLKPESWAEMQREILLTSGAGTNYGLGVSVATVDGRRVISHGGEVSGFTARNEVYPDERAAIIVFTNLDATDASSQIASKIAPSIFTASDPGRQQALERAKAIFAGLQRGKVDRSLFTSNANAYFSEEAISDFASTLRPFGTPKEFTQAAQSLRGGMVARRYRVVTPKKTFRISTFWMPDGKLEQYIVTAE
ncbi:MAG TPA: serine hydrolase [Thermoanaerobaculia bacterium]|nr:serine hydrolase [Thermoanaerobaculia bacterium]